MYKLDDRSKSAIERRIGMSYDELRHSDFSVIDAEIGKRIGQDVRYPEQKDDRLVGRGSPLLGDFRFSYRKDINKEIKKIK